MQFESANHEVFGGGQENGRNGQQTQPATLASEQGDEQNERVTSKALLKRLEQQGKRCALTGWPLTPQTVSLDHIVPLTEGGADDMSNVQLVHGTINSMKGTMSQAEFIKHCKAVASHCMFD